MFHKHSPLPLKRIHIKNTMHQNNRLFPNKETVRDLCKRVICVGCILTGHCLIPENKTKREFSECHSRIISYALFTRDRKNSLPVSVRLLYEPSQEPESNKGFSYSHLHL